MWPCIKRLDEYAVTEVLNAFASIIPPPQTAATGPKVGAVKAAALAAPAAVGAAAATRHRSALAPLFGRQGSSH